MDIDMKIIIHTHNFCINLIMAQFFSFIYLLFIFNEKLCKKSKRKSYKLCIFVNFILLWEKWEGICNTFIIFIYLYR